MWGHLIPIVSFGIWRTDVSDGIRGGRYGVVVGWGRRDL